MSKFFLIFCVLVFQNAFSQVVPKKVSLTASILSDSLEFTKPKKGLISNFVLDISFSKSKENSQNKKIWIANGSGISVAEINPDSLEKDFVWETFTSAYKNSIPIAYLDSLSDSLRKVLEDSIGFGEGSIAALVANDKLVCVTTAFNFTDELVKGDGISITEDEGKNWLHFPQPLDSLSKPNQPTFLQGVELAKYRLTYEVFDGDTLVSNPITTAIQNITYDAAIDDTVIWIASFAGGLRKSEDKGKTFQKIIVPGDELDTLKIDGEKGDYNFYVSPVDLTDNKQTVFKGSLNYRGFSVAVGKDAVWYGSAFGINKSLDGKIGKEWAHFNFLNSGLSGNWIISLASQIIENQEIIWVGVMPTDLSGETSGIAKSEDGGKTWETVYTNTGRIFNIAFNENYVYATGEFGVYVTKNGGKTWAVLPKIQGEGSDLILTNEFYSVGYEEFTGLWVGSGDGLANTKDNGLNWKILRVFPPSNPKNENYNTKIPDVYAYPNPFSSVRDNLLEGDGHLRIHYFLEESSVVSLKIYSFAMEHVVTLLDKKSRSQGERDEVWSGKDRFGRLVANGVYFYKLQREGKKDFWGKIVIVN
ncbi:hypothetical protein IT568_06985 [bacterium]|nr:hypothetical protein [bacterium]